MEVVGTTRILVGETEAGSGFARRASLDWCVRITVHSNHDVVALETVCFCVADDLPGIARVRSSRTFNKLD
jgi:hypothetical protein